MRLHSQHLLLAVIVILCGFFSLNTLTEYQGDDAAAAAQLAERVARETPADARIFIALPKKDEAFGGLLEERLRENGRVVVGRVEAARDALQAGFEKIEPQPTHVAGNQATSNYDFLRPAGVTFFQADSYTWPSFLRVENLRDILDTMSVIAVMAIGMTLVIMTGGIDLSVGRMAAFATVTTTLLIRAAGGREAAPHYQLGAVLAALAICACIGWVIGCLITYCEIPAFLVTLAFMLIIDGGAEKLSGGQTITGMPKSFGWLHENQHAVLLMLALYVMAHLFLGRTVAGRYVYAVGGNYEAARLSGVPVRRVTIFVYVASAVFAGLGGIILASVHGVGDYKFAPNYELYAIAAVVIGGTSLRGGEGTIAGTFLGALLITILDKGMSMMGLNPDSQRINKGVILLLAAFIDQFKHWQLGRRRSG